MQKELCLFKYLEKHSMLVSKTVQGECEREKICFAKNIKDATFQLQQRSLIYFWRC